tara:strand:+ start:296 stop:640 length:345 start_codon:yes stop_codon:yes gene_type:complete
MGLDQYAYIRENTKEFYWRKHSKLQEFMENIWYQEQGNNTELNCQELVLTKKILEKLLKCVETNTLPESEGRFFYGEEIQDEVAKEYQEEDIKFCKEALQAIKDDKQVIYSCWY